MNAISSKNILLIAIAFIVSALLLTVIQVPIGWGLLAWAAMVPFVLVCSPDSRPGRLAVIAYIVSVCYWLGNLYWIGFVTRSGWVAFCLYTALLWPMLGLAIRYCRMKNIPLFIAVPILIVGAEWLQGLFFGGFCWRFLAHSQYDNITLIQIADIFGAGGVSFLMAMVNGLIAELIISYRKKKVFKVGAFLKVAFVCASLAGAVIYGNWRIKQIDELAQIGPMVGSVQPNVPQSVKDSDSQQANDAMFNDLLDSSRACAAAGAKLIVWPETIVPGVLDQRILRVLLPSSYHKTLDKRLSEHSRQAGYILAGALGGSPKYNQDGTVEFDRKYNSAFLYQPDGTQAYQQYNKIHIVPFGESVPFRDSAPWLHSLLMKFTPYDHDYTLDKGSEYVVFQISDQQQNKTYRFGVMICYEDTVPKIARKLTVDKSGRKRADWLVNISNDGWFVRFKDEKIRPSTELAQHTTTCVFRAVENRVAVLRSVNTGISCLIDTAGRIKDGFDRGNLPKKAMDRKGMAGWFVDKVPINTTVTFFSKYGQWLDLSCVGCFGLLIIAGFCKSAAGRNKAVNTRVAK